MAGELPLPHFVSEVHMKSIQTKPRQPVPLEAVIITPALTERPVRKADQTAVIDALVRLAHTMADSPERILQELVDTALDLCNAHSAGISLLEEENGAK